MSSETLFKGTKGRGDQADDATGECTSAHVG